MKGNILIKNAKMVLPEGTKNGSIRIKDGVIINIDLENSMMPESNEHFVDAAFPGMLPVINEYCVKQAIKTGIGLKAKINKRSVFDRKNYFYADLPQGYGSNSS